MLRKISLIFLILGSIAWFSSTICIIFGWPGAGLASVLMAFLCLVFVLTEFYRWAVEDKEKK